MQKEADARNLVDDYVSVLYYARQCQFGSSIGVLNQNAVLTCPSLQNQWVPRQ